MLVAGLKEGWELLQLASLTGKGVIYGRKRANKLLAFLQMNGFPVPIQFRNIQMGPASLDVDRRAESASSSGMLVLEQSESRSGFPRHDYRITPEGRSYVKDEVMPKIAEDARGDLFLDAIMDTVDEYLYMKDEALVGTIHRLLHLDDREELIHTFEETGENLEQWSDKLGKGDSRDQVDLAAAGAVEFALMALQAVHPRLVKDDDSTGPYIILYNAGRLARLLDSVGSLHNPRHRGDKTIVKHFDKILNALEVNCEIYEILEVPTDEDIESMFQEAASFVPDPETS